MSLVHEETRRAYIAQRGVSQSASITLTSHVGGYQARFECAEKCKAHLGTRQYTDFSHEKIPCITIPTEELHRAITKLSQTFSVALVDTVTDEGGTRFVLVWRINPTTKAVQLAETTVALAENLNLDEY